MSTPESFSPTQGAGWRPIAEAPRDGTAVLVRYQFQPHLAAKIRITRWQNENFGEYADFYTHWHPLPSPDLPAPLSDKVQEGEDLAGVEVTDSDYATTHAIITAIFKDVAECFGEPVPVTDIDRGRIAPMVARHRAQAVREVSAERDRYKAALEDIAKHYNKATPAGIVARSALNPKDSQ